MLIGRKGGSNLTFFRSHSLGQNWWSTNVKSSSRDKPIFSWKSHNDQQATVKCAICFRKRTLIKVPTHEYTSNIDQVPIEVLEINNTCLKHRRFLPPCNKPDHHPPPPPPPLYQKFLANWNTAGSSSWARSPAQPGCKMSFNGDKSFGDRQIRFGRHRRSREYHSCRPSCIVLSMEWFAERKLEGDSNLGPLQWLHYSLLDGRSEQFRLIF